jgi:hypothetical protein
MLLGLEQIRTELKVEELLQAAVIDSARRRLPRRTQQRSLRLTATLSPT